MTSIRRRVVLSMVSALLATGCAVHGLSFKQDERVTIEYPPADAAVTLPFTLRWTVTNFDGRFVVFFDRSPMRPDEGLLALVPENDRCRAEPGCPDADWLASRNIFVTQTPSLLIEHLPDRRASDRASDRHDVTIVLLGADGRRTGESAWTQRFDVERSD